jgi:hypothetical protein
MPLLGFSVPPPSLSSDVPLRPPGMVRESQTKSQRSADEGSSPRVEAISTCKHPVVCLDLDVIADEVAARLAASLLGHLLFLKNQVPL